MTTDLPLEVVPSPVIGCFFRAMLIGEAGLRLDLIGERSERLNSNLNEKHQFVVEIFCCVLSDDQSHATSD